MMLQRKGLLSVVGAILVLAIFSMAFPYSALAQSQQAVRVQIQKVDGPDEAEFGDVLLVKDSDSIILYGLTRSVPSSSAVAITVGTQVLNRNANFAGKFPIVNENPIRVPADSTTGTLVAMYPTSAGVKYATGTISFDFAGDSVRNDLPHKLVQIIEETPAATPNVGYLLLTQRVITSGDTAYIVDEFEGLSDGGSATVRYKSVDNFATVEVYKAKVDVDTPNRSDRVAVLFTDSFLNGQFVSNGSFIPFSIIDGNSLNDFGTVWLRILPNGGDPFLARVDNDITAGIDGNVAVVNNNDRANPAGLGIVATLSGTAEDPFSLITAYAQNATDSAVLAQAVADAEGNFSLDIPVTWGTNGVYFNQTQAFLQVLDRFSNTSALTTVDLDSVANIFESPVAVDQNDGTFSISGVVESGSIIVVSYLFNDDSFADTAGVFYADANGDFSFVVNTSAKYQLDIIDQAGNTTSATLEGKTTASDPSFITFAAAYPDIIVSGTVEANAYVNIFGHDSSSVPATAETVDTLPDGTFFIKATVADNQGNFSINIPASITSRIIYVQVVDRYGNPGRYVGVELIDPITGQPINQGLLAFQNIAVTNYGREIDDVIAAEVVSIQTGVPATGVNVNIYTTMIPDSEFIFYGQLHDGVTVTNADGSFQITVPDRDPFTNQIIEKVYLVIFDAVTNQSIGFEEIDQTDGLMRVGPEIGNLVTSISDADVVVRQKGKGASDSISINRVYPAGTPGLTFFNVLPSTAIPYVFVIVDGNDDGSIDVLGNDIEIVGYQPLFMETGIPFPGAPSIDLGENYWNPDTQSVVGRTNYFLSLMDMYGNLSPLPLLVELDTEIQNPDVAQINVNGRYIAGFAGAIEQNASISFYKDSARTDWIGTTKADDTGAFYLSGLTLTENKIYAKSTDSAGNESVAVELIVTNPVVSQFLVQDSFGTMHTSSGSVVASADLSSPVVALDAANDDPTVFYQLLADGTIVKIGPGGAEPIVAEQLSIPAGFARDIEVVRANPFQGYVLLGNGVVIAMGNAPFFGDMITVEMQYTTVPLRLPIVNTQLRFDDAIVANGVLDTEDENGNGVLDIIIGLDGQILYNEDTGVGTSGVGAGNGELDSEPLIDPSSIFHGFQSDIARDLELVLDNDGKVVGYVILDGLGVLWPFGDNIGADVVRPANTNGIAGTDIFRDLELIVENGVIADFITITGTGTIFGTPGGPLGAGASGDVAGYLSADVYGLTTYSFDIVRDIEMSAIDSNNDGQINYEDGFYVLTGLGTIQAIGGALPIENAPFLGIDIARDLEFGTTLPQ